ncbi:lipocalin family protein [Sphingomonas sp. AP4-R1]|jgi:apolipoprotein D and lipocalin family protein|uniref:lipocalin family protein n=1 Tax=Sphingomonas sp. AP4-R1 TaxID=2735134 RepID=UPI0014934A12|nr:lipocalin family protein [Sphingomonas sp. AP4-R1]QJU59331.1 lipocalin family protein [Sphingomonas sp. AP4-R1]
MKRSTIIALAGIGFAGVIGIRHWSRLGPVGNPKVPRPAKPVDLNRYVGLWYELARYENRFEKDCDYVTARYTLRDDGLVDVLNASRGAGGAIKSIKGRAKRIEGSHGARLKVSFFGPFYVGDYWILDRADDYSWSIVGEPSGRYLWLLSRNDHPSLEMRDAIFERTRQLGYDLSLLRMTRQS